MAEDQPVVQLTQALSACWRADLDGYHAALREEEEWTMHLQPETPASVRTCLQGVIDRADELLDASQDAAFVLSW